MALESSLRMIFSNNRFFLAALFICLCLRDTEQVEDLHLYQVYSIDEFRNVPVGTMQEKNEFHVILTTQSIVPGELDFRNHTVNITVLFRRFRGFYANQSPLFMTNT